MTNREPLPQHPRRLEAVAPEDFDPDVREALGGASSRPREFGADAMPVFDLFRVLANYPKLMKRLGVWGNHVLLKSSLPARDREIVILRTGWLCGARYEWAHHSQIALEQAGLDAADLEAVRLGPSAPGLVPREQALIRLVDELVTGHVASDATWRELSKHYDTRQLMDLVFAVGNYTMMSMALNTFGVQLEPMFQKFAN